MESLYDILGVDRSATADQIKSAYRTLARKLHPDVNKAAGAQEQFSKLQQAYEVLSSPDKRKRYDRTGSADGGFQGFSGHGVDSEEFSDIFNAFFHGRDDGPRGPKPPPRNLNIEAPLTLDLETVARGGKVKTRTPDGEIVEVTIPPAVAAGATLRVREKGAASPTGRRGDLLLKIRVKPDPSLSRGRPSKPDPSSLDLTTRADISIAIATLGGEISIDRLGQSLRLSVPSSTPSGRALRLKGRGLTNAAGNAGDLYVELRIVPPDVTHLTQDEQETLRRMCHNQDDSIEPSAEEGQSSRAESSQAEE